MQLNYILEGKEAVPCEDLTEWATWFEKADRRVAHTEVGPYEVSTVFLGRDHSFGGGPPLLFETMVFPKGYRSEVYCARYSTWEEAEEGHARAVDRAEEDNFVEQDT